jgi:hypothetical protein
MTVRLPSAVLLGVALVLIAAGCSSDNKARVTGKVTINGNPVGGAKVVFIDSAAQGVPAQFGTVTKDDGTYEVHQIDPGSYKVTVKKLVPRPGVKVPENTPLEMLEADGRATNSLPAKYADVKTTDLSATINPGDRNEVNLNLQGK